MNRGILPLSSDVKNKVFIIIILTGWIAIASQLFSNEETLKIDTQSISKSVKGNTAIVQGTLDTEEDVTLYLGKSLPISVKNGRFVVKVKLPDSINRFDIRVVHSSGLLKDSKSITVVKNNNTLIHSAHEIDLLKEMTD